MKVKIKVNNYTKGKIKLMLGDRHKLIEDNIKEKYIIIDTVNINILKTQIKYISTNIKIIEV